MEVAPSSSLNDVKFNNQAYLTSYLDEIIESTEPNYIHINTLDTSKKSFPEIVALLTGKTEVPNLSKLKTFQYSALVPKIRLFRVNAQDDSEYQFVFNKDYKYNVLDDNYLVGNNCGIKSINWILAGTNPVSAEKTIEVKIEFYFDSINAFSGGSYDEMLKLWNSKTPNLLNTQFDNPTAKQTTNYWSLIYHPGVAPDSYEGSLFRIKAIVGWEQIDTNIINEIFKDKLNLNEELYDSDLVMYLNLIQHNFNFNEDGTIRLTANYIASIENTFSSKRFDLLKGLKESINKLTDYTYQSLVGDPFINLVTGTPSATGEELLTYNPNERSQQIGEALFNETGTTDYLSYSQIERKIRFLTYLNNGGTLDKLKQELKNCSSPVDLTDLTGIPEGTNFNGRLQDQISLYEGRLQTLRTAIDENATKIKSVYYSKLIDKIIEQQTDDADLISRSFYAVQLDAASVASWLDWKNGIKQDKPAFLAKVTKADEGAVDGTLKDLEPPKEEGLTLGKAAKFVVSGLVAGLGFAGTAAASYFNLNETTEDVIKQEETISSKIILFTTIGHIVDAAYKVIDENLPKNGLDRKEFERNKIVFSTFASSLIDPNNPKIKSLASIPISINNLTKFLDEIMYKRGVTELSLYNFIKELTIKVAEPALESREVRREEANKYASTSISNTIITLGSYDPSEHPLDDYVIEILRDPPNLLRGLGTSPFSGPLKKLGSEKRIDLSLTEKSDLADLFLTRSNLKVGSRNLFPFNYYIFYDRFNKDFAGNESLVDDEKRGIYHYTLAQDYGLVKSINFKKIDQPFLKESKSVGKKTIYLGQFRDLYNAEVKMIGNNIYHPGMILFIKPNVEFGKVISNDPNAPTFAQITGVGGYYSVIKVTSEITDEAYTTTLDCVFHSNDGLQPQEAENKACNFNELEKAGLYNSGVATSPSTFLLKQLKEVTTEIEEEKQAEAAQRDITSLERRYERLTEPGKI